MANNILSPLDSNRLALESQSPFPLKLPKNMESDFVINSCKKEGFTLKTPLGSLNSQFDSLKEAKNTITNQLSKFQTNNIIVLGLELGYHTKEILETDSKNRVWVLEPSWDTLVAACQVNDFSSYIKENRLKLFFTPNNSSILAIMESIPGFSADIFIHRSTYEQNKVLFESLKQSIESYFQVKAVNIETMDYFQRLWIPHTLRNLPLYLKTPSLSALTSKFEGEGDSIIIVAAGPSLEKNIALLKNLMKEKKALLIAVNTVVPRLLKEDIEADIIVAVDPQNILTHHLSPLLRAKKAPLLVAHPSIAPTILNHYPGPILFCETPILKDILPPFIPTKTPLDMGGSVATAAYSLALQLKPANITFLGLDLAYTERAHIRGNEQDLLFLFNECDRWNSWEQKQYTKAHPPLAFLKHPGFYGKDVLIDYKFETYIHWLENRFAFYGEAFKTYNATEGGIAFKTIPNIPFKTLLSHFKRNPFSTSSLEPSKNLGIESLQFVFKKLKDTLHFFLSAKELIKKQIEYGLSLEGSQKLSSQDSHMIHNLLENEWMILKIKKPLALLEEEQQKKSSDKNWTLESYHILLTALQENILLLIKLLPLFEKS